jgi:CRP-like cAMP-binding protein
VTQGGEFLKIPSKILSDLKDQSRAIDRLFSRYADCLVAQILQSVACNARHSIEQRAARWLSAAISRTAGDHIRMTQTQLGTFLGVGRSYVARVLARFRADGLIETKRGGITILDRAKLAAISCDCTELVVDHFETVLRGVYPQETEPGNGAPLDAGT